MKPATGASLSYLLPGWLRAPVLSYAVAKELRVLLPGWLMCLGVMILGPMLSRDFGQEMIVLAYVFGCVVLGALSVGHEYTHHTLNTLLAQPVPRERIYLTKLGVLAPLLLTLALAGGSMASQGNGLSIAFRAETWRNPEEWAGSFFVLLPLLSGFLVAPWLTMLCRSPLAGAVFTIALPAGYWIVANLLSLARFGGEAATLPEQRSLIWAIFWLGCFGQMVLGGWLGWRKFMRLQSIDGPGAAVRLPRWLRWWTTARSVSVPAPSSRHPVWLLVGKELRLQQMTFVLAGLFLLLWLAVWGIKQTQPLMRADEMDFVVIFYLLLIPVLTGSLASAEERQFGTIEWQTLLPMSAARQWGVKVASVLVVALLVGMGLPFVLTIGLRLDNDAAGSGRLLVAGMAASLAGAAVFLAITSLYISSLCRSGLRALLVALPLAVVALTLLAQSLEVMFGHVLLGHNPYIAIWEGEATALAWLVAGLPLLLIAVWLGLVVFFGLANHRSAERGAGRIWSQLLTLTAVAVVGAALWMGTAALYAVGERARAEAEAAAETTALESAPKPFVPAGNNPRLLRDYGLVAGALNPVTNRVNLWASLGAFCRDQVLAGKALPETVTVRELVAGHYFPEAFSEVFGSPDQTIALRLDDGSFNTGTRLVRARLPDHDNATPVFGFSPAPSGVPAGSGAAGAAIPERRNRYQLGAALAEYYKARLANIEPLPATTRITVGQLISQGFLSGTNTADAGDPASEIVLTGVNGSGPSERSVRARLPDGGVVTILADGSFQVPPRMDVRMMTRYGLLPQKVKPSAPASSLSPELRKRYGLEMPETSPADNASTEGLPTGQVADPAPGPPGPEAP